MAQTAFGVGGQRHNRLCPSFCPPGCPKLRHTEVLNVCLQIIQSSFRLIYSESDYVWLGDWVGEPDQPAHPGPAPWAPSYPIKCWGWRTPIMPRDPVDTNHCCSHCPKRRFPAHWLKHRRGPHIQHTHPVTPSGSLGVARANISAQMCTQGWWGFCRRRLRYSVNWKGHRLQ